MHKLFILKGNLNMVSIKFCMYCITPILRYHSHKKKLDKIFIIQPNLDEDTFD